MLFDIKSCPAHVLTTQGAESDLLNHLRHPLRTVFGRRDHGRPQLLHLPMVMGILVATCNGPDAPAPSSGAFVVQNQLTYIPSWSVPGSRSSKEFDCCFSK